MWRKSCHPCTSPKMPRPVKLVCFTCKRGKALEGAHRWVFGQYCILIVPTNSTYVHTYAPSFLPSFFARPAALSRMVACCRGWSFETCLHQFLARTAMTSRTSHETWGTMGVHTESMLELNHENWRSPGVIPFFVSISVMNTTVRGIRYLAFYQQTSSQWLWLQALGWTCELNILQVQSLHTTGIHMDGST